MQFKARITHLYRKGHGYQRMYAHTDIRESDKDLSNGEPPFYYQVGTVAAPSISQSGNEVTITAAEADSIYYTTDETAPDKTKTKYAAPFSISSNVTVKAIAYLGDLSSTVASKACTYVEPEVIG